MPSNKAKSAIAGSKWINPLIWNPKNPAAQTLIKAKQSIRSNFDIILLIYTPVSNEWTDSSSEPSSILLFF